MQENGMLEEAVAGCSAAVLPQVRFYRLHGLRATLKLLGIESV
jgi:hypothetical protein